MLPQSTSEESLRAAIENNKGFSPAARQRALEFAPLFWKSREREADRVVNP
jgi:hypothetical protein